MTEVTYVINEFEKEIIVFNTATCLRLFELGNDPTLLYLFYVKTAKIQETNSVHATNSFCKKGLGWGDHRFNKTKQLLLDEKLIENVTKRDEKGQLIGHFVRIHYLKCNKKSIKSNTPSSDAPTHKVDSTSHWVEPACGWGETNAFNKNINADDKNTNAFNKKKTIVAHAHEDIFNFWNSKNIIKHKKFTNEMKDKITRAINLGVTVEQLLDAISNYSKILNDENYIFSYRWNLADFITRGITDHGTENKKGFRMFLSENNPFENLPRNKVLPEIEQLRLKFKPITEEYESSSVFSPANQTYYGFPAEKLSNSWLMRSHEQDIKENYNKDRFEYGDFCWLEEIIASIFFNRKAGYDLELLKALMSIWAEKKPEFKMTALELRGE